MGSGMTGPGRRPPSLGSPRVPAPRLSPPVKAVRPLRAKPGLDFGELQTLTEEAPHKHAGTGPVCERLHHPTHGTQPTAASPRGNQSGWRLRHPDQQKGQALRRVLSNDPCGPARNKPWHKEPKSNAAVLRGVYIPTFPLCKSPTCPGQGTQAALSPERKLRSPVALLPETIL